MIKVESIMIILYFLIIIFISKTLYHKCQNHAYMATTFKTAQKKIVLKYIYGISAQPSIKPILVLIIKDIHPLLLWSHILPLPLWNHILSSLQRNHLLMHYDDYTGSISLSTSS